MTEEIKEASKLLNLKDVANYCQVKNMITKNPTSLFTSTSTTYSIFSSPKKYTTYRPMKTCRLFRKTENMDNIMKFAKYTREMKLIIEEARRSGPRRSPRFCSLSCSSSTISSCDEEKPSKIISIVIPKRSKRLLNKSEKENEEQNSNKKVKSDENNVNLNDARRLVKKSIARNKLNTK